MHGGIEVRKQLLSFQEGQQLRIGTDFRGAEGHG
jgi:hypothetical protein